jgi:bifunctional non-homologous end joining protein LigD
MPLEQYRKKRNFRSTPEPAGRVQRSSRRPIFVVQKHDASHLHYDFRLEIDGVLVSWAVPKGPTLDPAVKRFATMTEDHPLQYSDFEGVIPEGEYGAGTMMVWDRGTYDTEDKRPAAKHLAHGQINLILHGKKLQGAFVLLHIGRGAAKPREKSRWLLIKRRDDYGRTGWNPEDARLSQSVLTGRTLAEIEQGRPARKRAA